MISLNSPALLSLNQPLSTDTEIKNTTVAFSIHQQWNHQVGWKNALNNLRLIIEPTLVLWLISPWIIIYGGDFMI
jgi:hypothetical protein